MCIAVDQHRSNFSRLARWSVLAAAITLPAAGFAQDQGASAERVFRDIFGVDPSSLLTIMAGSESTMVGSVSTVINGIAVFAAALAMLMTFFTGLAQSAHDGTVLGRRYSSLWVPLRAVIGLGFLTPLPGGYSLLQAIVIWIGTWGSYFADQAWAAALGHLSEDNAPTTLMSTPSTRGTVNALFNAAVCAARAQSVVRQAEGVPSSAVVTVTKVLPTRTIAYATKFMESGLPSVGNGAQSIVIKGGVSFDGADGLAQSRAICGEVMLERSMALGGSLSATIQATAYEQISSLHAMSDDLMHLANELVEGRANGSSVRRQLLGIESAYALAEASRIQRYGLAAADSMREAKALQLQRAGDGSWITAGAYYNTLSGMSNAIHESAAAEVISAAPRTDQMPASMRDDLEPYLAAAGTLTQDSSGTAAVDREAAMAGVSAAGAGETSQPAVGLTGRIASSAFRAGWDRAMGAISTFCRGLFNALVESMIGQPGDDPIIKLQEFGHTGLEGLMIAVFAGAAVAVIAGATGVGIPAAIAIFLGMMPTVAGIGLPLALLAYYLPLIPYIYWIFGLLAWVLLLLEAVAIAPMWAAAHVLPEGEGLAGQHAKQGWVLMISLLLRPILMVMGFVAAVLVIRFMSYVVGTTFQMLIDANMVGRTFGILSTIAYLIAMVGIVIAVSKQSFALIYLIPDRALRFLGGGESLGEMGGESGTRAAGGVLWGMAAGAGALVVKGVGAAGKAKGAAGAGKNKMGEGK